MKNAASTRTLQRARGLMERCLRPGRAGNLAAEFPLIFDERFGGRVVACEERGDVRSTCALIVRELVFEGASLRVGLLGSVATEAQWRGQGLAGRVLDQAEAVLEREGCALALLWADDPDFYRARGYSPLGWEVDFVIPADALAATPPVDGLRAFAPDDSVALHRLYLAHGARVERSREETGALLRCPGMQTLVLQRERDIVAYACLGRGGDFPNTIHEWGGAVADVRALAGEHARRQLARGNDAPIAWIAPPPATELRRQLAELSPTVVEGVLAMGKAIDADALSELFSAFAGGLSLERDSRAGRASAWTLRGPNGSRELPISDWATLLFAPRGERASIAAVEQALGARAPRLPLAPFVWGLDSI